MTRLPLATLVALGCSSSPAATRMPEPPPPDTRATTAGPLCSGVRCKCKEDDDAAGEAAAGHKRFELTLGPVEGELWARIDNQVFYKSVERAKECFYVDLKPGKHLLSLRARGKAGFGARLKLSEQAVIEERAFWYDTFDFYCGAPGLCDKDSLDAWKQKAQSVEKGKHDPCGSVTVKGISWQTGQMPDLVHPNDFLLEGTMKVYEFSPENVPGSEACDEAEEF